MNAAAITALLQLVLSFLGKAITNAEIDQVILVLEAWLPTIVAAVPELVVDVEDILATLKGGNVLTAEQVLSLSDKIASIDAAADAALDQALKEV